MPLTSCLYLENLNEDKYFAENEMLGHPEWRWAANEPVDGFMEARKAKAKILIQGYGKGLVEPRPDGKLCAILPEEKQLWRHWPIYDPVSGVHASIRS